MALRYFHPSSCNTASVVSALSVGFMASSMSLRATDYTWNGSQSNDWANAQNWSSSAGDAPGAGTNRIQVGVAGLTGSNTYNTRVIYSAAQGDTIFSGGSAGRSLIMGNGGTGYMEISGGTFISSSTSPDVMANAGKAYLYINHGTYQKLSEPNISGVFGLNFSSGTSYLEIGDAGKFTVTTLDFQNSSGGTADTTGTIQLNSGGTLSVQNFNATNAVVGTRAVNLNGGTVASLANATWADLANVSWVLQSATTFDIGHTVSFAEALSGVGGITKLGAGNFTLSGANNYTGQTTVSAGALIVANNSALGATGTGNGTSVSNGARLVLANNMTVTGEDLSIAGLGDNNGALQAASNATATWAGKITVSAAGETRVGSSTGGNLILSGDIDATIPNSFLGIRSTGNDTTPAENFDKTMVTLSGSFSGSAIRLFQGVLKLGASERIQDSAGMVFGHSSVTALRQRFDLNGFNETVAYVTVDLSPGSIYNEITNSSSTLSTLTLNSSGGNRTFSGIVTGNLALQKLGSNTVIFSGVNSYTGLTTIGAGALTIADGGALAGGGSVTISSGATFNLNSLATFTFDIGANGESNNITGAGGANLNGILNMNLSLADIANGNSWQLVGNTGTISWNGMKITSTSGDFSGNNGIWTLVDGDNSWTFGESTGVLSVVVVPEPGQFILSLAGIAGCLLNRRRAV